MPRAVVPANRADPGSPLRPSRPRWALSLSPSSCQAAESRWRSPRTAKSRRRNRFRRRLGERSARGTSIVPNPGPFRRRHHAAEPTAIGESLLVILAMRDELLAELIGWVDHANVDA